MYLLFFRYIKFEKVHPQKISWSHASILLWTSCTSSLVYLVHSGAWYIAIHTAVADPDPQIRGGGEGGQSSRPWDLPWIRHCTALTLPKIISSKSWLLKSWHMCRTHLIWKKNWSSSSAISNLASSGTNSRVALDWEIRISILKSSFWILQSHTKSENGSWSLLVLMINFISKNPKLSPTPKSKAWLLSIQINNLLHCTFNKTLKKANLQINPPYAVGNAPVCP